MEHILTMRTTLRLRSSVAIGWPPFAFWRSQMAVAVDIGETAYEPKMAATIAAEGEMSRRFMGVG
jgi:hypothetical protein